MSAVDLYVAIHRGYAPWQQAGRTYPLDDLATLSYIAKSEEGARKLLTRAAGVTLARYAPALFTLHREPDSRAAREVLRKRLSDDRGLFSSVLLVSDVRGVPKLWLSCRVVCAPPAETLLDYLWDSKRSLLSFQAPESQACAEVLERLHFEDGTFNELAVIEAARVSPGGIMRFFGDYSGLFVIEFLGPDDLLEAAAQDAVSQFGARRILPSGVTRLASAQS